MVGVLSMFVRVLVFSALLLLMTWGGNVADTWAQTPSPDDINRVAKQLSCPTCTGINVADCPTETCAQWRAKIGELLAAGMTDQEILEYFASRYGDHVLQVPPPRGFFLGIWVVPVVAILAALSTFVYLVHRWTRRSARPETSAGSSGDEVEDEYLRRVQQELDAWWK